MLGFVVSVEVGTSRKSLEFTAGLFARGIGKGLSFRTLGRHGDKAVLLPRDSKDEL